MMMKIMTIMAIMFCSLNSIGQNADSLYSIELTTIDQQNLSVNEFRGNRILIAAFDGANPDSTFMLQLKALKTVSDSLVIVSVPTCDSSMTADTNRIKLLKNQLGLNYIILLPAAVKKEDASQHALFIWLTHDQLNGHFNEDFVQFNQMFLVNGSGEMYAVIGSGTSTQIITNLIQQSLE